MSPKSPYQVPKYISQIEKRLGKTYKDPTLFSTKLHAWDIFKQNDDGTTTGYDNQDDFVDAVNQAGSGQGGDVIFNISINQSTTLPKVVIDARRNTGTQNYLQQENDFSTFFYSKEIYEFIIQDQLDFNNKVIFWTFTGINLIANNGTITSEIKDVDFYITDSYKVITRSDGSFDYAILRIKKFLPIVKRGEQTASNGVTINVYTRFHFYRVPIQPKNVRRIRRTMSGVCVLYDYFPYSTNSTVPLPFSITDNSTDWNENLFPFRLVGQGVTVLPLWTQELQYWADIIGEGFPTNSNVGLLRPKAAGGRIKDNKPEEVEAKKGHVQITGANTGNQFNRIAPSGNNEKYTDLRLEVEVLVNIGNFNDTELLQSAWDALDYILPDGYSLFGVQKLSYGANAFPRQSGSNGYWETLKEELLWFNDYMVGEAIRGGTRKIFGVLYNKVLWRNYKQARYSDLSEGDSDQIQSYTPYLAPNTQFGSQKRKDNLGNILSRTAIWMTKSWNGIPEGTVIENTVDTETKPWEYDTEKLNSHLGLWPFSLEATWEKCLGTEFTKQLGRTKTIEITTIGNTQYNFQYLIGKQYQNVYVDYELFYKPDPDGNNYVLEVEFDENQDYISRELIHQLGGDTITIEYFENTYEDSLLNGNIPCKIDVEIADKTIEIDLPPQVYPAPNNQGNPRLISQEIIYGTTSD